MTFAAEPSTIRVPSFADEPSKLLPEPGPIQGANSRSAPAQFGHNPCKAPVQAGPSVPLWDFQKVQNSLT